MEFRPECRKCIYKCNQFIQYDSISCKYNRKIKGHKSQKEIEQEEKHTLSEWEILLGIEILSFNDLGKELLTRKEVEDNIIVSVQ